MTNAKYSICHCKRKQLVPASDHTINTKVPTPSELKGTAKFSKYIHNIVIKTKIAKTF